MITNVFPIFRLRQVGAGHGKLGFLVLRQLQQLRAQLVHTHARARAHTHTQTYTHRHTQTHTGTHARARAQALNEFNQDMKIVYVMSDAALSNVEVASYARADTRNTHAHACACTRAHAYCRRSRGRRRSLSLCGYGTGGRTGGRVCARAR
jgi:hypothetical protein